MIHRPFCAYGLHISPTLLESSIDAYATPSSRMFFLMNSTAR